MSHVKLIPLLASVLLGQAAQALAAPANPLVRPMSLAGARAAAPDAQGFKVPPPPPAPAPSAAADLGPSGAGGDASKVQQARDFLASYAVVAVADDVAVLRQLPRVLATAGQVPGVAAQPGMLPGMPPGAGAAGAAGAVANSFMVRHKQNLVFRDWSLTVDITDNQVSLKLADKPVVVYRGRLEGRESRSSSSIKLEPVDTAQASKSSFNASTSGGFGTPNNAPGANPVGLPR